MGRPRKGVTETNGIFTAALPIQPGSKQRRQFSNADGAAVRAWYAAGEAALAAGRPLPEPGSFVTAPTLRATSTAPLSAAWKSGPRESDGHRFDKVAEAWVDQYYELQRRAQLERADEVRSMILELQTFLTNHGLTLIEQIENQHVALLASYFAGQHSSVVVPSLPGVEGRTWVTLKEATELAGLARSTVKRWRERGHLPSWHVASDGQVRIQVDELRAARSSMPSVSGRRGLSTGSASNKLWVMKKILQFAQANGVTLNGDPMHDMRAVAPDPANAARPPRAKARPSSFYVIRDIAAHLHPVHQLTLWLLRILGDRIGEAYGVRIGDIVDFGGRLGGAMAIERQGGRPFRIRDEHGNEIIADTKDKLKNGISHRMIPLPWQLMELIRVVIAAFHTDPDTGQVDLEARLIPGLKRANASGQQGFRSALSRAMKAAGYDETVRLTPHTNRALLITTLQQADIDPWLRRRFVGHAGGDDVHDTVYTLDPGGATPEALRIFQPIIDVLEQSIDDQLDGTLMVPTAKRMQLGGKNPLRARRDFVYTTLAAYGWYVEPVDPEDQESALIGADRVAQMLNIAVSTARRWMRDGTLPAKPVGRGRREIWMTTPQAVDAHLRTRLEQPTIADLAEDLELTYHQVYALVRKTETTPIQASKRGDIRLSAHDAQRIREAHQQGLDHDAIALPVNVAASQLALPVKTVQQLVERDVLRESPSPVGGKLLYVTRESLDAYLLHRPRARTRPPGRAEASPDPAAGP